MLQKEHGFVCKGVGDITVVTTVLELPKEAVPTLKCQFLLLPASLLHFTVTLVYFNLFWQEQ